MNIKRDLLSSIPRVSAKNRSEVDATPRLRRKN